MLNAFRSSWSIVLYGTTRAKEICTIGKNVPFQAPFRRTSYLHVSQAGSHHFLVLGSPQRLGHVADLPPRIILGHPQPTRNQLPHPHPQERRLLNFDQQPPHHPRIHPLLPRSDLLDLVQRENQQSLRHHPWLPALNAPAANRSRAPTRGSDVCVGEIRVEYLAGGISLRVCYYR